MNEDELEIAIGGGLNANIHSGQPGECEEIADLAVFLASAAIGLNPRVRESWHVRSYRLLAAKGFWPRLRCTH